nr:hypothetical protein HmN_000864100 [Hymenolepis microstoma]
MLEAYFEENPHSPVEYGEDFSRAEELPHRIEVDIPQESMRITDSTQSFDDENTCVEESVEAPNTTIISSEQKDSSQMTSRNKSNAFSHVESVWTPECVRISANLPEPPTDINRPCTEDDVQPPEDISECPFSCGTVEQIVSDFCTSCATPQLNSSNLNYNPTNTPRNLELIFPQDLSTNVPNLQGREENSKSWNEPNEVAEENLTHHQFDDPSLANCAVNYLYCPSCSYRSVDRSQIQSHFMATHGGNTNWTTCEDFSRAEELPHRIEVDIPQESMRITDSTQSFDDENTCVEESVEAPNTTIISSEQKDSSQMTSRNKSNAFSHVESAWTPEYIYFGEKFVFDESLTESSSTLTEPSTDINHSCSEDDIQRRAEISEYEIIEHIVRAFITSCATQKRNSSNLNGKATYNPRTVEQIVPQDMATNVSILQGSEENSNSWNEPNEVAQENLTQQQVDDSSLANCAVNYLYCPSCTYRSEDRSQIQSHFMATHGGNTNWTTREGIPRNKLISQIILITMKVSIISQLASANFVVNSIS